MRLSEPSASQSASKPSLPTSCPPCTFGPGEGPLASSVRSSAARLRSDHRSHPWLRPAWSADRTPLCSGEPKVRRRHVNVLLHGTCRITPTTLITEGPADRPASLNMHRAPSPMTPSMTRCQSSREVRKEHLGTRLGSEAIPSSVGSGCVGKWCNPSRVLGLVWSHRSDTRLLTTRQACCVRSGWHTCWASWKRVSAVSDRLSVDRPWRS